MITHNPLARLHEQFQAIVPDLKTVFRHDAAALKRIADTDEKLARSAEDGRLSTLVFGHYNAGKSTFINALLGAEVAPMGDVPLTASIQRYEWNEHVLFDSPGIDAPIEHEALTDEFITRECNAVIFVVPTGGALEEAATWQRLCSFLAQKKAVIIVINDKVGMPLNGPEFVALRSLVYTNMQKAAQALNLEDPLDGIDVLHVKARTALKARLEGKAGLLAQTGIPEIEAVLARFLRNSTDKILNSDRERARVLVNDAIQLLAGQSGDAASAKLAACRSKVEQERSRLATALVEATHALAAKEVDNFQTRIAAIRPDQAEDVKQILSSSFESSQQRLLVGVQKQLGVELERTDQVVREAALLLAEQVSKGEVDVADVRLSAADFERSELSDTADGNFAGTVLGKMKSMPIEKMTETGVTELLKLGKNWFPKLFKGIGPKTIGKWATAAGKYVGPVLVLGEAAYGLYQSQQQEQKARDEHRQFVSGVMEVVRQAYGDAVEQYELMIREIARSSLDPILKALDSRASLLQSQNIERQELQDRLAQWTRELG